ncbi:MAG: hypothetical protein ABSH01_20235 [Terriglobia bacterium]
MWICTGDIHLVEPLTGKVVRTFGTARSLGVMGLFRFLREGALESYIEPPPSIPFFTKKNLPSNFRFYICEVDLENLSEQAEYLTTPTELWGIGTESVEKPFVGFKPAFPLLMVLPTGGAGASKFELTLGKPTSVRFSKYQLSGAPMTSVKVEPRSGSNSAPGGIEFRGTLVVRSRVQAAGTLRFSLPGIRIATFVS